MLLLLSGVAVADTGWPQFRGPLGNNYAPEARPPLEWSETHHVAWKTAIPGRGWSTPVYQDGHLWVTTATEDGKEFSALRLDPETGQVTFNQVLFRCENPEPLGNSVNTYASCSPLIDQGLVFVHFGSYGTACLDAATGQEKWRRTDLPCRHYRGPGSSLAHFRDLLILTMDGVDYQYLIALDKKTGETRWRTDRTTDFRDIGPDGKPEAEGDFRKAYTTPLVIEPQQGEPWLISIGARAAYAYDCATGKERWHTVYDGFSNASSPVYSHGLVFINTGYGKANLHVFKVDDNTRGELKVEDMVWDCRKRVPLRSTPVVVGDHLYMVDDGGFISCLEVMTGEVLWSERLEGNFSGCPLYARGHLFACSEQGTSYVIQPDPEGIKVVHENRLDEGMLASPIAVGEALYLRTRSHLYKIAASAPATRQ